MDTDIEIFKAGSHTDSAGRKITFADEDVAAIASSYDPAAFAAPIVAGHPKSNDPAYGWVKSLQLRGDGVLMAQPEKVEPAFAEAVKAGRYRKVSASLYPPDHPNNPKPGKYYLRHVGFLGAAAPAVKGLKPVDLAADDEGVVTLEFAAEDAWTMRGFARLFRSNREMLIEKFGTEDADKAVPDYEIGAIAQAAASMEEPPDSQSTRFSEPTTPEEETSQVMSDQDKDKEEAERLKALEEENAALKKENAEFAEAEAKRRRADNAAFVKGLVKDGRLAPGVTDDVVAFMETLDAEDTVDFAEGQAKTPLAFFKELLSKGGQVIDLAEHSAGDAEGEAKEPSLAERQKAYYEETK